MSHKIIFPHHIRARARAKSPRSLKRGRLG
nr:MAG TPA: hypothetical protein [Caudoviricetes sp.]